jgi:hypothetical protein
MMKLALATISLLAATTAADANPTFYNATADTLTVEATFPNGKVEKRQLRDGSWGNTSGYFLVPPGVDKLSIKIFDDVGGEQWSGTVGSNDVHVTIPDGKKTKTIFAGIHGGGFDTPKASLFINITGEDLTVDLEGMNGIGAHRGIKPGPSFDPNQLVRLDPKETYFKVTIKPKTGEAKKLSTSVGSGKYYLISTHPKDGYRVLALGHVPPPKKK